MQTARELYRDLSFEPAPVATARNRSKRFRFADFLVVVLFLGAMGFIHVYQQALIAQNGIDIARLNHDIKDETKAGKHLKIQQTLLQSPERVERLAKKELGMTKPEKVNYIVLTAAELWPDRPASITGESQDKGGVLERVTLLVR
jgi:cell division protein FtsL